MTLHVLLYDRRAGVSPYACPPGGRVPVPDAIAVTCGHASCAARARGLEAQGRTAYETVRDGLDAGLPDAVYMDRPWADLPGDEQRFWSELVDKAEEAFWQAWGR